ncbi:MAG: FAD-dependent oxidoreductase [Clostridia bacterium]|nr:FAD-dependent oxidoreductase [Clostridia bacterium]
MLEKQILMTDLCVIGGGMAGICAAIAAAREGARVVLMQERPVLGGNASSEIRMWVCGAHGKNNRETGIIEEIALENLRRNPTKNFHIWDTVLYDFVLREKNITLLLNCTCMDANVDTGSFPYGRDRRIRCVTGYQMTTQHFVEVHAAFYADCSGDSILAPLTGALYREGREGKDDFGEPTYVETPDCLHMGMSCLIQGRQTERAVTFTPPSFATKLTETDFTHRTPNLYNSSENFWYLELGGNRDAIGDTEAVARDLRALALGTWDHVKNSGHYDAENWELEFLGFLPGKRESRRMVGEYTVTANDLLENTFFPDAVAYGGWPIDDHYPDGFYHEGRPNTNILPEKPYSVPYRALYSQNVENLFFAGRNISMTHMAMSSVRVMATCALLGQAVGTAAAIAIREQLTPHGVFLHRIGDLQEHLMDADCFLPPLERRVGETCRTSAPVDERGVPIPNGEALRNGQDRPNIHYGTTVCGLHLPNGKAAEYRFPAPVRLESVHLTFDSDLDRTTLPGDWCEQQHATRANICLDSPQFHLPLTLVKAFRLEIDTAAGTEILLDIIENATRSYQVELHRENVSTLRLVPLENYGGTDETRVFSFDFR